MKKTPKTYEVILSNLMTAADNPVEAVTQFCVLSKIPKEVQDEFMFQVRTVETGEVGYWESERGYAKMTKINEK